MPDDANAIDYAYLSASGNSFNDCTFLGQRFLSRYGYEAGQSESWVIRNQAVAAGTDLHFLHPSDTQYSGLWRSPAGVVYVSDATHRCIRTHPDLAHPDQSPWGSAEIPMAPYGIWGIDDQFVVTWGVSTRSGSTEFPMSRFDGSAWSQMPNPGFEVYAIHGNSPQSLWAVGEGAAHFDGKKWHRISTQAQGTLTAVFVVSDQEVYATSNRGALLQGDASGLAVVAQAAGDGAFPLLGVAWWKGALWVAGGTLGLLRRVGQSSTLEVVKDTIPATSLDARKDLVVTTRATIAGSSDGVTWKGTGRNKLTQTYASQPLLFFQRR